MNVANKNTDQSLSNFQTGTGTAAHATVDIEHLIFHTRAALVHTITSLQGSDGGIMSVPGVHELLPKIHDILGCALSKWVGNAACILAYLLNFASKQHCKVWVT